METFKKILLDIIPVVVGVLIALFIGSLKQSYDDQKFLDKMYDTIAKEMETNSESISQVLTNHYAFVDSISANIDKDLTIAELFQSNFQKASIQNTGWHSFINSRLELADFEMMAILSNVEETKKSINLKYNQLMDFTVLHFNSNLKEDKKTMMLIILNLINSEEHLISIQEEYLEWHEKATS